MENNKSEVMFVGGLFLNKVSDNAPAFIITNQSIHMETLFKWLQANKGLADEKGYIRIVGKEGQSGKRYFQVDTYKPKVQEEPKVETVAPEGKGIDITEFTGEVDTTQVPF